VIASSEKAQTGTAPCITVSKQKKKYKRKDEHFEFYCTLPCMSS